MGGSFIPLSRNWRWYEDNAAEPTVAYAAENTTYTGTLSGSTIFRLRWNWAESGGKSKNNATLDFEYSTDQVAWNTPGPTAAWDYANGLGTDDTTVAGSLLSDTTTLGDYVESAAATFSFGANSENEFDVAIQTGTAHADGSTYYFRAFIDATGVALGSGETYPQIIFTAAVANNFTQKAYRLYPNSDSLDPSSAYTTVENRKAGNFIDASSYRIRVGIENVGADIVASSVAFKLQYTDAGQGANAYPDASLSGLSWTDVGAIGSGAIWRGVDNVTPLDGSIITTNLLTDSTVKGHYVESATSPTNANDVSTNDVIEYDWVLNTNGIALATYYAFRVVESTGDLFTTYSEYPRIATINTPANHEQHQFATVDASENVITGEDIAVTNVQQNDTFNLRLMHKDGGDYITGGFFRLKYYTTYVDFAADTNGTILPSHDEATTEDWKWYDDGSTNGIWSDHGQRPTTVVTADHGPETGVSMEHHVSQGDAYLLDWTAVGTSAGPEHNLSIKHIGVWTGSPKIYYMRIELDGTMLALSNMHYGTNKAIMFTTAAPTLPLQINIGGVWKDMADASTGKINIGGVWKTIAGIQINIGDAWKTVF